MKLSERELCPGCGRPRGTADEIPADQRLIQTPEGVPMCVMDIERCVTFMRDAAAWEQECRRNGTA